MKLSQRKKTLTLNKSGRLIWDITRFELKHSQCNGTQKELQAAIEAAEISAYINSLSPGGYSALCIAAGIVPDQYPNPYRRNTPREDIALKAYWAKQLKSMEAYA